MGKVGLVVLCSGEHEDDEEFKKDVLGDEEFVGCLKRNDLLVWGADIRSREGYQGGSSACWAWLHDRLIRMRLLITFKFTL